MKVRVKQNPPNKKKAWIVNEVAGQVVKLIPSEWSSVYRFEYNGELYHCSPEAIEEWDV